MPKTNSGTGFKPSDGVPFSPLMEDTLMAAAAGIYPDPEQQAYAERILQQQGMVLE